MSAFRGRRSRRFRGEPIRVDLDQVLDGFPCPCCEAITAPDALGIWSCLCGWSGVLVSSEGYPGIA